MTLFANEFLIISDVPVFISRKSEKYFQTRFFPPPLSTTGFNKSAAPLVACRVWTGHLWHRHRRKPYYRDILSTTPSSTHRLCACQLKLIRCNPFSPNSFLIVPGASFRCNVRGISILRLGTPRFHVRFSEERLDRSTPVAHNLKPEVPFFCWFFMCNLEVICSLQYFHLLAQMSLVPFEVLREMFRSIRDLRIAI